VRRKARARHVARASMSRRDACRRLSLTLAGLVTRVYKISNNVELGRTSERRAAKYSTREMSNIARSLEVSAPRLASPWSFRLKFAVPVSSPVFSWICSAALSRVRNLRRMQRMEEKALGGISRSRPEEPALLPVEANFTARANNQLRSERSIWRDKISSRANTSRVNRNAIFRRAIETRECARSSAE